MYMPEIITQPMSLAIAHQSYDSYF